MVASLLRFWTLAGLIVFMSVGSGFVPAFVTLAYADSSSKPEIREVTLKGKVVLLTEALKDSAPGLKVDPEAISRQVALICNDRSILPILPDEASRALFQDERLRNRSIEIRGRRIEGVPYLQVIHVRVEQDGRLRTPEYFCHVCTISLRYPQACPCCQGPMEFRMKPDRP